MSIRRGKRYTTQTFKKKEQTRTDPYTMVRAPKGPVACPRCRAVFLKKRWTFDEAAFAKLEAADEAHFLLCPACLKIRDEYPEGLLTVRWEGLADHETDVMGLLRNIERRALSLNPLERIIKLIKRRGEVEVQTTNETLAQRMGRELVRAFHGTVTYRWGHKEKLARVEWIGPPPRSSPHHS
jgi:NMD protein affecting ribosome stability and mRNA decay